MNIVFFGVENYIIVVLRYLFKSYPSVKQVIPATLPLKKPLH